MDVLSSSDLFIAFSIYAHRAHSIYLTTLSRLETSINESRRLTFDSTYGAIIDYSFPSKDFPCDLYILFASNTLLKVNVQSVLSSDQSEFFEDTDPTINQILARDEFHLMNNITSNETIFKQLFKNRGTPGDSSYYKRKTERIEQQEEKKRKKEIQGQ